jgi:hypothetical protein
LFEDGDDGHQRSAYLARKLSAGATKQHVDCLAGEALANAGRRPPPLPGTKLVTGTRQRNPEQKFIVTD